MFRSGSDRLGWSAALGLGVVPVAAVVALGGFLALRAGEALVQIGIPDLLWGSWQPLSGSYGVWLLVVGTAVTAGLALLLSVPVGLLAAIYLALYAGPRVRVISDTAVALLGTIPSVVIGLWGITWIAPVLGYSLATAALVLAMMVAPTFTLLAGAALRQVPGPLIETVRALGISETVTVGVVVRHARWGILGAATLAACRGLGEAVAVSMVAGNVVSGLALDGPIATLTTTLIVEFDGAAGLHRSALFVLALLVLALIVGVSVSARFGWRRP